ncbi:MAG: DUF1570 domain-containing protein [Acidobacteriota bacterium]
MMFILVLIALLVTWPAAAAASEPRAVVGPWTKVQSENFVFIGDARESEIRRVAQKLEQFRETLVRILGEPALRSPVPTVVFVFANDRSFAPYRPLANGRPVETVGYFEASEPINYIALVPSTDRDDLRVVFHEYTHLIVHTQMGTLPLWMEEGLAEFYESVEERDGGRIVLLGRPEAASVHALTSRTMPLADLLGLERSSRLYTGQSAGTFYAQAWALVHYLLTSRPRAGQLATYIGEIRNGAEPPKAFAAAFKTDVATLDVELTRYLQRFTFPVTQFTFATRTAGGTVQKATPIPEFEARAYLAEMLAAAGRDEEARAELQKVLAAQPTAPRVVSALGTLELYGGRLDAAMPLLERAAQLAPDDGWIQGTFGRGLGEQLRRRRQDGGHAERLVRARAVLSRANVLAPRSASTLFELALVELEDGGDMTHSRALLEAACKLAPGRERYRVLLSRMLMSQGEADHAAIALESTQSIRALMTFRSPEEVIHTNPAGEAVRLELAPADYDRR